MQVHRMLNPNFTGTVHYKLPTYSFDCKAKMHVAREMREHLLHHEILTITFKVADVILI